MDDASVRGAVVQIDALLEGDGGVFVLAGRGRDGSIPPDWRVAELRGCCDEG
jgi:hypothetical protein